MKMKSQYEISIELLAGRIGWAEEGRLTNAEVGHYMALVAIAERLEAIAASLAAIATNLDSLDIKGIRVEASI